MVLPFTEGVYNRHSSPYDNVEALGKFHSTRSGNRIRTSCVLALLWLITSFAMIRTRVPPGPWEEWKQLFDLVMPDWEKREELLGRILR